MNTRIYLLGIIVPMLLTGTSLCAQNLWLYSTNGKVEVFSNANWSAAGACRSISPSDSIRFGSDASITIFDRKNDKLYAIQKIGSHSVNALVAEAQGKSRKQSKDFIAYLWNSLRGKNSSDEFRKAAGVVYRDDDINLALASAVFSMSTTLPIEFDLLDEETRYAIGEMATVGNSALIKVKNHSAMDLFVNVIDIDVNGNLSACIPVVSPQQMTQLLIPAGADVVLDSFPIVFAEPRGEDQLILVASPEWFDIEAVVEGVKNGKSTTRKVDVGVFKQRLIVK